MLYLPAFDRIYVRLSAGQRAHTLDYTHYTRARARTHTHTYTHIQYDWQGALAADVHSPKLLVSAMRDAFLALLQETSEPCVRAGAALCAARLQNPHDALSTDRCLLLIFMCVCV